MAKSRFEVLTAFHSIPVEEHENEEQDRRDTRDLLTAAESAQLRPVRTREGGHRPQFPPKSPRPELVAGDVGGVEVLEGAADLLGAGAAGDLQLTEHPGVEAEAREAEGRPVGHLTGALLDL